MNIDKKFNKKRVNLDDWDTIHLPPDDPNLKRVTEIYGKTHFIEAVRGTSPDLRYLRDNQSVCSGDGESYSFILTELNP